MRTLWLSRVAAVLLAAAAGQTAWSQASDDLVAPKDLEVCQVDYGDPGTLILSWESAELYEAVDLFLDGEPTEGSADGAARTARVLASPGRHAFAVRGIVGNRGSELTSVEFDVLRQSPLLAPVKNVECEFLPGGGGKLRVSWALGEDAWVSGVLEVPRWQRRVEFEAGATEAEIEAEGGDPHIALLTFKNAENYTSPPYTPFCLTARPAFRRGDCDNSGRVNITDAIFELNHLFRGGQRWFCDDACDSNDDGSVNISDPVSTLMHLFAGSGPLPPPGTTSCGADLTEDLLGGLCTCE